MAQKENDEIKKNLDIFWASIIYSSQSVKPFTYPNICPYGPPTCMDLTVHL